MTDLAPGCFGSPTCCSPSRAGCSVCPWLDECLDESVARAERIEHIYGLSILSKRNTVRPSPVLVVDIPEPAPVAPALNKHAQRLVNYLESAHIDLRDFLTRGVNPFKTTAMHGYLAIIMEYLLSGGFHKRDLEVALKEKLRWTEGTAKSHVRIAVNALKHLGLVEEFRDQVKVKSFNKDKAA